jgi:putative FmdB family regulatory protein
MPIRDPEENMPIYDYRCDACTKTYDVYHKVREVIEDVMCPHCGSSHHTRLLSAPMVKVGKNASAAMEHPGCGEGNCCGGSCGLN